MDEPVEDFNASWGGGNEWATADDDPFAPKAKGSSNFDLNADPDFEGWLNAQSQSKAGKKPLPKGLAKSKTSKTSSTGKALPKSTSAAKSTLATRSKQAPKPKADDDDWGDSWD
jgi:SCY1-like protein 1